jgi:hypothetical protein
MHLRALGQCVQHQLPGLLAGLGDRHLEAALPQRLGGVLQPLGIGRLCEIGVGRARFGEGEGHICSLDVVGQSVSLAPIICDT